MSKARCIRCEKIMSHTAFNNHECPFSPRDGVRDGETFEEYVERAEHFAAFVREVSKVRRISPAKASVLVADHLKQARG